MNRHKLTSVQYGWTPVALGRMDKSSLYLIVLEGRILLGHWLRDTNKNTINFKYYTHDGCGKTEFITLGENDYVYRLSVADKNLGLISLSLEFALLYFALLTKSSVATTAPVLEAAVCDHGGLIEQNETLGAQLSEVHVELAQKGAELERLRQQLTETQQQLAQRTEELALAKGMPLIFFELDGLEPLRLKVFKFFAARVNSLVTAQDLRDNPWEGAQVSDSTVSRCIAHLRSYLANGNYPFALIGNVKNGWALTRIELALNEQVT